MKELETYHKAEQEIVAEISKKKVWYHLAPPKKGQKVWKVDMKTHIIDEVKQTDYSSITTTFKGGVKKELQMMKGFVYLVALNKANAARKYLELLKQIHQV